jgi:large subunit ribosomal protein L7/L12
MHVPVPVLIAIGLAVLVLLMLALRRRGGDRDLIAPPPVRTEPSPRTWPGGAAPIGSLPPALEAEVRALLAQNRKIDAIKLVRQVTHLGLGEAKELVERL